MKNALGKLYLAAEFRASATTRHCHLLSHEKSRKAAVSIHFSKFSPLEDKINPTREYTTMRSSKKFSFLINVIPIRF